MVTVLAQRFARLFWMQWVVAFSLVLWCATMAIAQPLPKTSDHTERPFCGE